MEDIILKAHAGNKSAITALYNGNKDTVYSIAYSFLQNKDKAEKVVFDVFSNVWYQISAQNFQTEKDFTSYCISKTVLECKKVLSKVDSKIFQAPKSKNFIISTDKKATNLTEALAEFTELQKFIFIAHILTSLTPEEIAKIVCVDITSVKLAIDAEKINLDKIWSYTNAEDALKSETAKMRFVPNDASIILSAIDNYVEPFEKKALAKKIKIISIVLSVCVAIAIIFGLYVLITEPPSSSNTEETSSSIEAVEWVTSVTATDYAVIDIKDYGKISVALDGKTAPITVTNFKKLVNEGFYNGLTFHRIINEFMMQGGDPQGNGYGGSDETIKGEFIENGVYNNLAHVRGAISMARSSAPDSASSQFFIVHQDNRISLDKKYAAFGYVVDGMDVVDKVCTEAKPIDGNGTISADDQPIINSIKIYSVEEFSKLKDESQDTSDSYEENTSNVSTEESVADISAEESVADVSAEESVTAQN